MCQACRDGYKVVVAGTRMQFRHFISTVPEENRHMYIEASAPEMIAGIPVGEVIEYGTWYERNDATEIIAEAQMRQITKR